MINHDHTRAQRPLEAPSRPSLVNDLNMQELDHSRARANDLQKAQAEQLAEITRISKELECFEPVGIPLVLHYHIGFIG